MSVTCYLWYNKQCWPKSRQSVDYLSHTSCVNWPTPTQHGGESGRKTIGQGAINPMVHSDDVIIGKENTGIRLSSGGKKILCFWIVARQYKWLCEEEMESSLVSSKRMTHRTKGCPRQVEVSWPVDILKKVLYRWILFSKNIFGMKGVKYNLKK